MKIFKPLLKIGSFLFLLYLVLDYLTKVHIPKSEAYFQFARAPYCEKKEIYDVIFLGSSHIEWGIDPNVLWKDFGIPTLNYAVPGMDLKNTYFLLKEITKYQKPKVVVIDVYRAIGNNHELTKRMCNVMPLSLNKYQLVNENIEDASLEKKWMYFFPLYYLHARKIEGFDYNLEYKNFEKGHCIQFGKTPSPPTFNQTDEVDNFTEEERSTISRLLQFSKENNIEIVFVNTPNLNADIKWKKKWNNFKNTDITLGSPYIDFNDSLVYAEAGLNYMEDVADDVAENGHLNHRGAVKITTYLGTYLRSKYSLPNKRKEKEYDQLNASLQAYNHLIRLSEYGDCLKREQTLQKGEYILSMNKKFKLQLDEDGSLVLLNDRNNHVVWTSGTSGLSVTRCVMQGDGNLVLYDDKNNARWASNTTNNTDAMLVVQNSGNLTIYSTAVAPIWSAIK